MPRSSLGTREERAARWDAEEDLARGATRSKIWVGIVVLGLLAAFALDRAVDTPLSSARAVHDACGGALHADEVAQYDGETETTEQTERYNAELGRYYCELGDGDKVVLALDAAVDRAGVSQVVGGLESADRLTPSLAGVPGWSDERRITLLPPCPGAGRDIDGDTARAAIGVEGAWRPDEDVVSEDALAIWRSAIRAANSALERLGCETEPLSLPRAASGPWTVPFSRVGETGCRQLAGLPLRGKNTPVRVADVVPGDAEGAPLDHCVVELRSRAGESGRVSLRFSRAVEVLVERLGREAGIGSEGSKGESGRWLPALGKYYAYGTARCGGERVGYLVTSNPQEELDPGVLRSSLAAYAQADTRRLGCTGLRLPGEA
ncbi:hypothetical protein [Streptomyces sulphureus]|uniref:hypothetical protein n=1 Tax=Streptomyces sulphureus TaxID=47758 RepID=UPI0003827BCF|nr:hypothetical protein [Streptomyces sulphureus]